MSHSLSKLTRREALGKMVIITAGASVALLGTKGLLIFLSQNHQPQSGTDKSPPLSAQLFLNVEVYYLGMAGVIGSSMENMQISAPSSLSQLITEVCQEHPALETMHSMQILLNGTPPQGNPMLKNGDTVAFLGSMTGG